MPPRAPPRKARNNSAGTPGHSDPVTDPEMADSDTTTKSTQSDDEIDPESLPDRKLLLQIIKNQKAADKKSEERHTKLTKQVRD